MKKMKSTASVETGATICLHKSGAMQFAAVSSWARRFFKSVTMATQDGSYSCMIK